MDTQSIKWLRWAFNCKLWKPTAAEWLQANRCIQGEEMQRIERFVFQSPAISAMVCFYTRKYFHFIFSM